MQEVLNKTNGHSLPPNQRAPREYTLNEEELKDIIFNATSRDTRALRKLMQEKRDYDNECDYPSDLTVSDHYKFYFDYHAVGTRVCEVLPLETWQVQPSVFEDDDPNVKTEFEKAWDELGSSLRGQSWHKKEEGSPVWEYLKRADVLSGIGSFGVILLGFDDGQPLNTPVAMLAEEDDEDEADSWDTSSEGEYSEDSSETVSGEITGNAIGSIDSQYDGSVYGTDKIPKLKEGTKRKLIFMRPFDETLVQVTRLETDINSPRHNQPVMYRLTLIDPDFAKEHNIAMNIACPEVHWTRILHIADNLTNSECFGVPRQQPVYRHLRNLYKLYGGAPEMYWRGALNGLSFETHPQLGGDVDIDKNAFKSQIEDYRNGLQRDLLTTGMTVKSVAPQVVDPTPNIEVQITAICIKLGCPKRIFMGSERGELASTQDDSAWNDRLKHRQDTYVTPRIIIPFIDRMIATGVLPKPQGKIIEENLTEDEGKDQELIETSDDTQADSSLQGKVEGKPTTNAFGKPPSSDSKGGFAPKTGKAPPFGGKPSSGAPSGDNVGTGAPAPAAPKARKLPEKDSEPGYCIVWPDLDSMTDAQKATIALQKTQALMAFIAGNGESAMTLVDFYTKVLYLTDEEAIGVIQAVNEQIEADERLTPDPEQARQEQMEMEGEKFDKELEAKKELAESGQGFQAAMFDRQTEVEDKRLKNQPKDKPVANLSALDKARLLVNRSEGANGTEDPFVENYNPSQPRDSKGRFGSSSGGGKPSGAYKESGGKDASQKPDAEDVVQIATEMRDAWEYKLPMQVSPAEGREFEQGGVKWKEGGNCNLTTGQVTIWRDNDWNSVNEVRHLAAHEMMHGSYEQVRGKYKTEVEQIMDSGHVSKILKADGTVRPEFKDKYPTYDRLNQFIDKPYDLASDDGVTEYSKAYWKDYHEGRVSHHIAVHETLAEIAGIHESTGVIQGSKLYRDFYKATRDEYRVLSGSQKKRKGVGVTTNQRVDFDFVTTFKYLDEEFMPVEDPQDATWLKWWHEDGSTGWARRQGLTANYSPNQPRKANGEFGSGGGSKGSAKKATKAETAKASAVAVGKEIQNYAKNNEASIAKKLGGVSFPDSEPVDVVVPNKAGVAQHGIEMKTMVKNGNFKLTMDGYAQARKVNWEKSNQATFHTLVVDDHAVFNAKGPGKHDYSKREYYYRRGVAGSARVAGLHKAKNLEEVKQLMEMDEKSLPKAAQRTDKSMRNGTWKPFTDEKGKGFKNKKTGETVRAKK